MLINLNELFFLHKLNPIIPVYQMDKRTLVGYGKFTSSLLYHRSDIIRKYRIILLAPTLRFNHICLNINSYKASSNALHYLIRRYRIMVSDIYGPQSIKILLKYFHLILGSYSVTYYSNALVIRLSDYSDVIILQNSKYIMSD